MTDPLVPDRKLIGRGLLILLVAALADVLFEFARAEAALQNWVCAGVSACESAYVIQWFSNRFPFYATGAAVIALLLVTARVGTRYFQSRLAPAVARAELFRWIILVVALIAVAELVACTGDATCALSKTCI